MSVRKTLVLTLALAGMTVPAFAQDQGNNNGGERRERRDGERREGGDRGGRGNWDPAQWRQQVMGRLKEELKAPDDEWKVLEPKLSKVMDAQRDVRSGSMTGGPGGGRRGGGGGGGGDQPQTEYAKAANDLRELLRQENPSVDQINSRLAAYRAARTKAEGNLKAARTELVEILTERQEAVLVAAGMLE
jgi:hypothetical protein